MQNSELNQLFENWLQERPDYNEKGFKKDGIIDERLFAMQKAKGKAVLFLCKEPNDLTKAAWDYRTWWKEEIKYNFSIRLAQWAYGIVNDFPTMKEAADNGSLNHIAFMNVKKIGGGAQSDNEEIISYIKRDKEFLLQQIKIINPDIIIGCLTVTENWEHLFEGIQWQESEYDIYIAKWKGIKLIDFYHPSAHYPSSMFYTLLEKVYNSNKFQIL